MSNYTNESLLACQNYPQLTNLVALRFKIKVHNNQAISRTMYFFSEPPVIAGKTVYANILKSFPIGSGGEVTLDFSVAFASFVSQSETRLQLGATISGYNSFLLNSGENILTNYVTSTGGYLGFQPPAAVGGSKYYGATVSTFNPADPLILAMPPTLGLAANIGTGFKPMCSCDVSLDPNTLYDFQPILKFYVGYGSYQETEAVTINTSNKKPEPAIPTVNLPNLEATLQPDGRWSDWKAFV
jgi:hypothetical protein